MSCEKYIGMDVHQATISVAVMDSMGKLIMESILETKASTILEFLGGLRGTLSVTFEEGTSAAWLYDLLKPHVAHVLACNPRKNAALHQGNRSEENQEMIPPLRGGDFQGIAGLSSDDSLLAKNQNKGCQGQLRIKRLPLLTGRWKSSYCSPLPVEGEIFFLTFPRCRVGPGNFTPSRSQIRT